MKLIDHLIPRMCDVLRAQNSNVLAPIVDSFIIILSDKVIIYYRNVKTSKQNTVNYLLL